MACQIHRTADGKINRVTAPNGSRSKLFDAINNNIFMSDAETSVKIMNNAYSDKATKMFEGQTKYKYDTGEPQLFYKSPQNKVYDNLEEVLINEDFGKMSMGFRNPKNDEFIPIANFTTKGSTKNEFLHAKVREGLLSADRVLEEDGTIRYQGKGAYSSTKVTTAIIVADDLAAETGNGRYKVYDDGTIDIEFSQGYSVAIDTDGNQKVIQTKTIPEYLKKNPNVSNKVDLLREFIWEHDIPVPIETGRRVTETPMTDLNTIEDALYSFLESIGFSVTTLEEYENSHSTKYGKDLHISALIDIANSIVAFKDGQIAIEDLSEEVAHIAISSYSDQKSITRALANVHMTPEYTEFSEKYRKAYSDANPDLTASEVEDKVRKEILGKILSKELTNRFSTENKTKEQANLITYLRDIWRWFTNLIQNNVKSYHNKFLQDLNRDIANSVLSRRTEDFQAEISEQDDIFFSLLDEEGLNIERELRKSKAIIERLYQSVIDEKVPNQSELERIGKNMNAHDIVSSSNNVISVTARQINVLKDNIEENKKTKEMLSVEDSNRYFLIKENLLPTVNNVVAGLREMIKTPRAMEEAGVDSNLRQSIDIIIDSSKELSLAEIEPYIDDAKLAWDEAELNKILEHTSLTQDEKNEVRRDNRGNSRLRDLGWFGKFFGLASQSKNPALQRMYLVASKIIGNTNREFLSSMNVVLENVVNRNVEKHQKSIIHKDSKGNVTHFYLSPRDYAWAESELARRENEYISNVTGLTVEEVAKRREEGQQIPALLRPKDSDLSDERIEEITEERYQQFKDESKSIREDLYESRFTDKYYQDRDVRYDKANVSDMTRRYLSGKNSSMNQRHKKAGVINPDGTKDLSKLSKSDRQQDVEDFKNHARIVSPYDSLGNIKQGLVRKRYADLTKEEKASIPVPIDPDYTGDVTLVDSQSDLDSLNHDSRIALDLFNLNMLYRSELKNQSKNNKAVERFLTEIKELEDRGEIAFDWLMSNASVGFTNEFYESMGTNPRYAELAQDYINNIADESMRGRKQIMLDHLMDLQRTRKELLKQNRKARSAVETDAKHMLPQVRAKLLDLDNAIYEARRELNIPREVFEDIGGVEYTEVDLNDDFNLMLEESGLDEFKFALKHMSIRSQQNVYEFARQIEDYINNRKSFIRKDFKDFANEAARKGILEGKSLAEIIETLKGEYAKNNVASYFRRFQPEGYTKVMNDLDSGALKVSEILENKEGAVSKYPALRYVEINPDYSWREDVNNLEYVNPNFKAGDPLSTQPKKLNEEFFSRYGISQSEYLALEDEDISKLTATKNKEEFNYLVATVDMRKQAIENYNDTGSVNPYLRVQLKRETAERALSLHKTGLGGIKDWFSDFATSQIDELEYGEVVEDTGINVKLIPKYYQRRIDASLITQNSLQASMMDLKASIRYKERMKAERDVNAIQYRVKNQTFKARGIGGKNKNKISKSGEVSTYAEKIQEMADYHLYGVRQNRQMVVDFLGKEIHLDQLFSNFTKYVRNVNLAYNPLVDITSYTTGLVNNLVDTASGDYYHTSSAAKASKMLPGMIGRYMIEEGKIDKTSELVHLMEFFNIETPEEERLFMSSYKRGMRIATNSYYLGAKYANLPITPRNMLAVLHDYKFHNGRFKSYNDFARDMRAETDKKLKNREITAMWSKIDDTFYSNLTINPKKGVAFNSKFESKFDSKEKAEEEFEFYHQMLLAKIAHINQNVDAIVSSADQLAAQRDALVNAFMLHRGWFVINMSRKFKGKHFNLATGQYEAGHYMTILSSIGKFVKNLSPSQRKEYREVLTEYEIRNLKRAGFDALAIGFLIALTNMLMAADDEDDSYVENLAQLIAMRTTNETQSQYIHGIPNSVLDIYKDPLVQGRMLGAVFNPKFFSEDEDKRSKAWKKLYKQALVYRRPTQLSDLQYQLDAYMHFNKNTLWGIEAVGKKKEDR